MALRAAVKRALRPFILALWRPGLGAGCGDSACSGLFRCRRAASERALLSTRAAKLAALAAQRRADGSRGLPARRAWRRLRRAGDRGDQAALSAVWQVWVRAPCGVAGEELWQALSRWQERQQLTEAVFEAAVDPGRPPGERAAIGEFCSRHDLAPHDPVRRALFYVLTGQTDQHRAANPDGRLLATGYGLSGEPTRAALRSALASAGGLDVVRVVGGGDPGRCGPLTAEERDYLTGHLVSRRDWAGLWRVVRDLPLAEAVAAARLFSDGWRPAGETGAAPLGLLRRAEAGAVARSAGELAKPTVIDVKIRRPAWDTVVRGSFSPDGRRLLVAVADLLYQGVQVYDLPSGSLLERHDYPGTVVPPAVVHLGGSFLVVGNRDNQVWELVRYADGQPHVYYWSGHPMTAAPHPARLVVLEHLRLHRPEQLRLRLYDASGAMLSESRIAAGELLGYGIAAEPVSGRMVVSGRGSLRVLAADGSAVIAVAPGLPSFDVACFTGPDSVVAVNQQSGHLGRYQIVGSSLELRVTRPYRTPSPRGSASLAAIPGRCEVAVSSIGGVRYYDAATLARKDHPDELGDCAGDEFWGSAGGRSRPLSMRDKSGRPFVRLIWGDDIARELAGRPMGSMKPADLATVTTARRGPAPEGARPFLELMRDCLELRLATDAGLADAGPAVGGADDFALGVAGERPG